ncbi:MAG TPA: M48 family metallopeptidase [Verrucomicrobiota bacterium]|nr:M48 family metallopeptidase [Verrucomicrobiota bacterium]HNU52143.1 M48 family metallopeptidase [Verrucomicrobiota bacterium]
MPDTILLCQAAAAGLILARAAAAVALERLNQRHVLAHRDTVPEAFRNVMDAPTYQQSVAYTLAKSRFAQVETVYHTLFLAAIVFSGLLPWAHDKVTAAFGTPAWVMAAFLFGVALAFSLSDLPTDGWAQFRLEQQYGFNTTPAKLWWADRCKGLLLSTLLGYPLLLLVLKIAEWLGSAWWLAAWAAILAFQFLVGLLAPAVILPLFNKFKPLPEGPLKDRLVALAQRTGFRARSIQVMDGSKRSRHSNAFFTGFGRFRKIVLFDTLLEQLDDPQLEAVLAHEIGHNKKRHIVKMLVASALGLLVALAALAWLAGQPWFPRAFGFASHDLSVTFLLFGLLGGTVTYWLSPVVNLWLRRNEYEADAFAATAMSTGEPLIGALRKLSERNLANLTPHPIYSAFHYSHPTLLEREQALRTPSRRPPQPGNET